MPTSRRMPYDTNKLDELTKLFEVNGTKVVFGGNVQADGEFLDSEGHPIKETTSYISLPN